MIRGEDGRIAKVRYVLPRHKAANWVGPGRGRKSTRPGANGAVELSPCDFLDRLADLVPPPRKHRHRAGSREVRGLQAGEGQDGFSCVKSDPDAPRRTARASARLSRPRAARRLGRTRSGPRRPGNLSGTDSRAARHRHPQPLTAFHATVRTARKKSGFKTGLRRREKSGLERG